MSEVADEKKEFQSGSTKSDGSVSSGLPESAPPPETPGLVEATKAADQGPEFKPGLKFYGAFSALGVMCMLVALDSTSVSIALPVMAKDLGGSAIEAFWTGTSFLLTCAVFQLPIVSLSHIFGRMQLTIFSVAVFGVGILVSSVAKDFVTMLAGRTVQGIGGGGIFALLDIIVTDLVPLRLRGSYLGVLSAVMALGTVAGPIVGGGFAEFVTWRWIFWIHFPFIVIALVIVPLFMRLTATRGTTLDKFRRIDWTGILLLLGAATSFLISLTWGGVSYPWASASTLVPLLVGASGLVGFVFYELYVAEEPCVRIRIINNYNMAFSLYGALIHTIAVYAFLYFLPLYFQAVKGYEPIISGVALFPLTFIMAPMSIVSGVIITKTGDFRGIIIFGWICLTVGCGVMVLLDADTSIAAWIFILFAGSTGAGSLYSSQNIVNQSAAPDKDQGHAVGTFIFFRSVGQCLGVAICGVVFQNQMEHRLSQIPSLADRAAEYSKDAASLVETLRVMPSSDEKTALIVSYTEALKIVWVVMTALCGTATIASFFMRYVDLNRALNSEQALQEGKKEEKDSS